MGIMINSISKHRDLNSRIAQIYLYLLFIRLFSQLAFLQAYLSITVNWMDSIISFLGLLLLILSNKGVVYFPGKLEGRLFRFFSGMIFLLCLSSFFMSLVLYNQVGTIAGESTLDAFFPTVIYFMQYILMIYYNIVVFDLLDISAITKIIDRVIIFEVIVGYFQVAMVTFAKGLSSIQNAVDIFGIFYDANTSVNIGRISLTGREAAGGASFITVFFLPYLFACILSGKKEKKYYVLSGLLIPLLIYTKSSTGYILFCVLALTLFIVLLREGRGNVIIKGLFIVSLFVTITLIALDLGIIKIGTGNIDFAYILLKKIDDKNNMSTVNREVNLYMNWGAFCEYPILGVGNGNQGFFFSKYVPSWANSSPTIQRMLRNPTSVTDGATFYPGGLSGYGIFGVILYSIYKIKAYKCIEINKDDKGLFYYMYRLASPCIFIYGFSSGFSSAYWLWFIISIPFIRLHGKKVD